MVKHISKADGAAVASEIAKTRTDLQKIGDTDIDMFSEARAMVRGGVDPPLGLRRFGGYSLRRHHAAGHEGQSK